MSEAVDAGRGFSYTTFTEEGVTGATGLILCGPAGPDCPYQTVWNDGTCCGAIYFEASRHAVREGRPRWKVLSTDPLTLDPSIRCKCHAQHGHIRNGRYEPA